MSDRPGTFGYWLYWFVVDRLPYRAAAWINERHMRRCASCQEAG